MRLRAVAFALVAAVLLTCSGCINNKSQYDPSSLDAAAVKSLYEESAKAVENAANLSIRIDETKNTNTGIQTFKESAIRTLQYNNLKRESFCASVEGSITIGKNAILYSEQYKSNTAYITVSGSSFTSQITPEDYTKQYTPAVPIDPSLYQAAKAEVIDGNTVLTFSSPSQAEIWALPETAEFTGAFAVAVLTPNGELVSTSYSISYTIDGLTVSHAITVMILSVHDASVVSPNESITYTKVDHPQTPLLLEKATAHLLQATDVQSTTTSNIICEAFAINRDETISLNMSGSGDAFRAQISKDVHQINQSKGGEVTQIHQEELFENGSYSISSINSEAVPNPAVSQDAMLTYCQNILVDTILLPEHITGASITETDAVYRIVFTASEEMTQTIFADICNTLYGDPDLLDTLASSCTPEMAECYLEIQKSTGLPVSYGLLHKTVHSIQEISYLITYQTNQIYTFTQS